jgi:hypothetical protein
MDVRLIDTAADASSVLGHVCFRVDPQGEGISPAASMRYLLLQGYKLAGSWDTRRLAFNSAGGKTGFPPEPGQGAASAFWLRVLILPQGLATFVDGAFVMFSPHPPSGSMGAAVDAGRVLLKLPYLGDSGELATWKLSRLWWGSCDLDVVDHMQARIMKATIAAAASEALPGAAEALTQLWITGVPSAATEPELVALLSPFGTTNVKRSKISSGAAIAVFSDNGAAVAGLKSIQSGGGLVLHGTLLQVVMGAAGKQ